MKKLITLLLLSLIVGVTESRAAGKTIYLDTSSLTAWRGDGAVFAIYSWTGETGSWSDMATVSTNLFSVTLPEGREYMYIGRCNPNQEHQVWNKIGDDDTNKISLLNGYDKYTVTGWNAPDYTPSVYGSNAQILSVMITGDNSDNNPWNNDSKFAVNLTKGDGNVWTGSLDLSEKLKDQTFKLVINGGGWIGTNNMTIDNDVVSGWIKATNASDDQNCSFYNSITGYKTYNVTATWAGGTNYVAGWTLKIEGNAARTENVTSVTFVNNGYDKVYAYPYTGGSAVACDWPGVKLSKTGTTSYGGGTYDVYTFKVTTSNTPSNIIFNNNNSSETAGWPFSASFQYIMNLPATGYYIVKYDGSWAVGDAMTEPTSGTYRGSVTDWANKAFAIAPNTAVCGSDFVDDGLIIRPVTDSGNWIVNFQNYSGVGCTTATGGVKAWQMAEYNDDKAEINFTPASTSFTINSSAIVTIGSTGYATYSNNWAYQLDGSCDVYTITQAENNEATTNKLAASASIPARTGVILYDEPGDYTVTPASGDAVDVSSNLLVGSGSETYLISGDLGGDGNRYYTPYVLTAKGGNVRFYLLDLSDNNLTTAQKTLAPHKAFLAANRRASQSAPALCDFFNFNFGEDSETTGINSIENGEFSDGAECGVARTIENVFDLQGRRVAQPKKGLYIVNGKKVVIN